MGRGAGATHGGDNSGRLGQLCMQRQVVGSPAALSRRGRFCFSRQNPPIAFTSGIWVGLEVPHVALMRFWSVDTCDVCREVLVRVALMESLGGVTAPADVGGQFSVVGVPEQDLHTGSMCFATNVDVGRSVHGELLVSHPNSSTRVRLASFTAKREPYETNRRL